LLLASGVSRITDLPVTLIGRKCELDDRLYQQYPRKTLVNESSTNIRTHDKEAWSIFSQELLDTLKYLIIRFQGNGIALAILGVAKALTANGNRNLTHDADLYGLAILVMNEIASL